MDRSFQLIAGVDEAGRGPLAGPVVAAAVILDPNRPIKSGLRDSKKLSPAQRDRMYEVIVKDTLAVATGIATVEEIDALNILRATLLAMRRAVQNLTTIPQLILVDGNQNPGIAGIPTRCIIKGDASEPPISAASIIAKVTRDRMMLEYDRQYPGYGFAKHKGYGTSEHLLALERLGPSPIHRFSFAPVRILCQNKKV